MYFGYLKDENNEFILDIDGYIKDLGIPKNQVLKIKVPSTFDYRKSPIISFPSGKMNYQNTCKTRK